MHAFTLEIRPPIANLRKSVFCILLSAFYKLVLNKGILYCITLYWMIRACTKRTGLTLRQTGSSSEVKGEAFAAGLSHY